jgi:glucose-6-phosphate 1-dehydrogenase
MPDERLPPTFVEAAPVSHRRAPPAAIVIFGASGDLTRRRLLPAIRRLGHQARLIRGAAVVGVGRTALSDEEFRELIAEAVGGRIAPEDEESNRYVAGAYDDPDTYRRLGAVLSELDEKRGASGNRLYYLSIPPGAFPDVIKGLAGAGLHRAPGDGFARIVIEKPYGHDLQSALALDELVHDTFDESDVFRIDHFLAKETVQNLLALRFANSIFQPIWNRTWVDHVQITVAESIGVESRGGFYESAGAMRDIVQNHVLQVLALALMEPPTSFSGEAIRNEKVKLLQSIRLPTTESIERIAVRGQYARGGRVGELMAGYREEMGVDPLSRTETFVALRLDVDNWRWSGVPFFVRTGKRLPVRVTEVLMEFHRPPHLPVPVAADVEADALILRIQPDEGISLRFGAKVPGHEFRLRSASMEFSYEDAFPEESPEAYERLIFDALVGDPTLFTRSDEVIRSWMIVDPIIEHWSRSQVPVALYEAGSWGPREADRFLAEIGREWRNPDASAWPRRAARRGQPGTAPG